MHYNKATPIHVSNVGLYDRIANLPVRVRCTFHPLTNQKIRISKKTGLIIPKPSVARYRRVKRGKMHPLGLKDTQGTLVAKVTYEGQDFAAIKKEFELFIAEKERKEKFLVFNQ